MFDFLPRRINPDYRKQITFSNLKNNHNDQFLDILANNVDEQRVRFHSQFYHVETPFSMPCIDFDNVMLNSPTVRTFTIRNINTTPLRLLISSSLPDEVTLYKEGPGSTRAPSAQGVRPLSSSPPFLPVSNTTSNVNMSSSAPTTTILATLANTTAFQQLPPQVQIQAQGQAAQAQAQVAQAQVRRMEMLMKLMEDDIIPESKKHNSYLDLAGIPNKRRTTLAWIDPTPAPNKNRSNVNEDDTNNNNSNVEGTTPPRDENDMIHESTDSVEEMESYGTPSPRRHLHSRSPSPIFALDEDVSPSTSPPRRTYSPRGNKPSLSSIPLRTSASGMSLPSLRSPIALSTSSIPSPSVASPSPTVNPQITSPSINEEESPLGSLASSSSSLATAIAAAQAPPPINLSDLAQKFEDTSPPPIFNDYEGEAKYILSQIDRIRQLDQAIVEGLLEPLSVLGILHLFYT